jgi:hypothetical protein
MRARREFETSAALTVRLDRQILDRSGSPYGAKRAVPTASRANASKVRSTSSCGSAPNGRFSNIS